MTGLAAEPVLSGALTGFALADVLQLLELGARSGVLAVEGGPAESWRIEIRGGRVVSAAAHGRPPQQDVVDVLARLLDLLAGRWTFHAWAAQTHATDGAPPAADGMGIGALLVDAARRRDERARAGAACASPDDQVPRPALESGDDAPDFAAAGARVTAFHLRVLAAADGVRDLRAIAASLRCDVARVRDAVASLRALGLVEQPSPIGCLT